MKMRHLLVALPALAAIPAANAGIIVIDDFSDGAFSQSIDSGAFVGQEAASVLGGFRDYGGSVQANPLGQSFDASVDPGVGLVVSAGAGLTGVFGLEYDGGDDTDTTFPFDDQAGGLVIDISAYTSFELDFIMLDLDMSVSVIASNVDGGGNVTGVSSASVLASASDDPFTLSVSVGDLAGTADLASVNAITILFNDNDAAPNRDYALSQITLVPAPGAAVLLAIGGLVAARRRR